MTTRFDPAIFGNLRTFDVAARLLSFTKAAGELNITQSAVSQQIRNLEDRLAYPLFVRHHGRLALTQRGQTLFETSSRAFHDIERTLTRLDSKGSVLHVGCLPSFALGWLMPRLPDFHRENPDIVVRLEAKFHNALTRQAMRAGNIDVAIRLDHLDHAEADAEPILDEYLIPVATPEYLTRHPAFASGQSLEGVTLLHDAMPWDGAPEFVEWRTWLNAQRPDWLPGLGGVQFNLSTLAVGAAQNHQGVAIARTSLVMDDVRSGRLVDVFGRHTPAPARYVLLTERHENPDFRRFSQWIREECRKFDRTRKTWLLEARPARTA
ncbi:MAG: LysR substrate-binding domain-containing protein [Castellaniella sp.]|uniref:LysR substrate-binding domain-containing protein n=1 Tax=Castellaniella sp. TaxID=1955812 RepID=UPI003C71675D